MGEFTGRRFDWSLLVSDKESTIGKEVSLILYMAMVDSMLYMV